MAKVATNKERLNQLFDADPRNDTEIGKALGVSKQSISAWRSGERSPKLSMVEKIAAYYGTSVEWLLGWDLPAPSIIRYHPDETSTAHTGQEMHTIPQIAIMGRGMEQLTPEQRTLVVDMMRPLFKSYFTVDLPTEDNV